MSCVYTWLTISIPAESAEPIPGSVNVPIHLITPYHGAESGRSTRMQSPTSKLHPSAGFETVLVWDNSDTPSQPVFTAAPSTLWDATNPEPVAAACGLPSNACWSEQPVVFVSDRSEALDENLLSRCWRRKSLSEGEVVAIGDALGDSWDEGLDALVGAVFDLSGPSVLTSSLEGGGVFAAVTFGFTGLSVWASSLAWMGRRTPAASEPARSAEPMIGKWYGAVLTRNCPCLKIY